MNETPILLSTAYLAPVEYYTKLFGHGQVWIEQYDHYRKQTYRNRCVIASPNGPQALTFPTEKTDHPKALTKDVRLSDHGNWRHVHWNALEAAYRHSPFFDYYADEFHRFYERRYGFLIDFNLELCQWICRQMDLEPDCRLTESYEPNHEGKADFRELIHPKKDFRQTDPGFRPCPYYQVFEAKWGFQPNLSIVDLLFNMGPESLLILRDSIVQPA